MSLTRQIKVKPDDALGVLAKENGRIYVNMDSSVVTSSIGQINLRNGV